ncbi:MAG: histone [Candidatus Micrarchaeota archaeon]
MDDFIRGAGAQRVSECASKKLREILEDESQRIVFQAKLLARHAGRNQLTREDIRLAVAMMQ